MGVVFRPVPAFRWSPAGVRSRNALPPELAFLREYGVGSEHLACGVADGRRQGVDAFDALLARGDVSDTLFYKCLAHLSTHRSGSTSRTSTDER